ncbi:hypothetical protein, partial [Salmonella enterica]|uniref:hypothetical protein n=1 Tax=Salmonella enterica TaxID=28901 RepID=UPI0020C2C1AA
MTPRTAKTRMLVALLPLSLCVLPALAQAQAAAPAKPATAEPPAAQDTVPVVKKFGEIGGWTIYAASVDGQHMACSAGPRGEPGM